MRNPSFGILVAESQLRNPTKQLRNPSCGILRSCGTRLYPTWIRGGKLHEWGCMSLQSMPNFMILCWPGMKILPIQSNHYSLFMCRCCRPFCSKIDRQKPLQLEPASEAFTPTPQKSRCLHLCIGQHHGIHPRRCLARSSARRCQLGSVAPEMRRLKELDVCCKRATHSYDALRVEMHLRHCDCTE